MKHSKLPWVLALIMLWGGIALFISSCSATESELIPRKVLFGNPMKAAPTFSGYLRGIKTSLEIMGICSGSLSHLFTPTSKQVREEIKKDLKNLGLI